MESPLPNQFLCVENQLSCINRNLESYLALVDRFNFLVLFCNAVGLVLSFLSTFFDVPSYVDFVAVTTLTTALIVKIGQKFYDMYVTTRFYENLRCDINFQSCFSIVTGNAAIEEYCELANCISWTAFWNTFEVDYIAIFSLLINPYDDGIMIDAFNVIIVVVAAEISSTSEISKKKLVYFQIALRLVEMFKKYFSDLVIGIEVGIFLGLAFILLINNLRKALYQQRNKKHIIKKITERMLNSSTA